ncbi:protein ALWAYS EARLY 3-like isoform X2 [Olea europaea var. sylvestris]|uniref:protein ALWAYS EARLY 3-like isoform X2 n=1 Tax=Olea europaea var. sylvestris TaxID=158386 RepID=UPI000C1D2DD0|nr:protein ALWAYS EARLY 3-like isoform X2 [Olea europaea var. sylvestris]
MGPTRKSRSVNKRYSYINEVFPHKDGDSAKRSKSRKRKLFDMLGPQWSKEELICFYEAYRKHGKDWKKMAGAVRNRSVEMMEALYTMNRAYLSLPEGTASVVGLIAMMTDHYSNLAGSDSEQESNDGAGSSRNSQKRARGKLQPTTSKKLDVQFISHSQTVSPNNGCVSVLKKKRSGGSRPRPVGKRTPRFPVSFSYENINAEMLSPPTRQGLKLNANVNNEEVAHEIAIALAEASQRGGSPQVSQTPNRRAESVMYSPFRNTQRKHSVPATANAKLLDMDEEDLEGSMEAETGELTRNESHRTESESPGTARQKGRKFKSAKVEVDYNSENHLNDVKEECSRTEEGPRIGTIRGDVEVTEPKISRSSIGQRKKSKKVLFGRDEDAFDALQTLADLSLMMPTENEEESRIQLKDEDDHVDESESLEAQPVNQKRDRRRSAGVRMNGYLSMTNSEVASSKTSKRAKGSVSGVSAIAEENPDSHQSISKTSSRKKKMLAPKIQNIEAHPGESLGVEAGDSGKKLMNKSKKASQTVSPELLKVSENSSCADLQREGSDTAQSADQVPAVDQVNLPTKARSRCKMDLKKRNKIPTDQSNAPFSSLQDRSFNHKKILSNCLLNPHFRRWCAYEWFYSAIDYPWFAKREFVEYLYHVGLGHIPRLTRVEWGVIRSSLGKPRRFSEQFLKEEKEKLNQYRDSVRKHYSELREGIREGLPTDLARSLSVGQRVIAIHPKTREIHDGSVLTVDHSRCRIQFDRPELGVEFVMDIDCMPLYPFENMPALLWRHALTVDKFFENFNELKMNGRVKENVNFSLGDNLDNVDGLSHSSPAHSASGLLKQTKMSSANAIMQARTGPTETTTYQQTAYSHPYSRAPIQAKEADVQALTELTRALDKKEAVVLELRRMNDDVLENQKDGDDSLKESEPIKKQYATVLVQLNEANEQSIILFCRYLRLCIS